MATSTYTATATQLRPNREEIFSSMFSRLELDIRADYQRLGAEGRS